MPERENIQVFQREFKVAENILTSKKNNNDLDGILNYMSVRITCKPSND